MLILALDSATKALSVALLEDERSFAELYLAADRPHSQTLLAAINELFNLTGRKIGEVALIACTVGPGAFTGLRIAVSTAKGLAFALNKPVAAISTLEALALNQLSAGIPVCAMLDAKRNQVYGGLYLASAEGLPQALMAERLLDIREILSPMDSPVIFTGEGALKYRDLIMNSLGERARFPAAAQTRIAASAVGVLGFRKFLSGSITDAAGLKPRYIRPENPGHNLTTR